MKKKLKENISFVLFIFIFTFSCILTSRDTGNSIFSYISFEFQIVKSLSVLILNFIITIINKRSIEKAVNYSIAATIVITIVFFVDNYFISPSDSLYNRLLWMSTVHLAILGVYSAVFVLKGIDFDKLSKRLIKGYTFLYIVIFAVAFIRPAGENVTMNFVVGDGTFFFFDILKNKPYEWVLWFVLLGNCIFFIPLPFILKTFIPKIKLLPMLLVGIILPFLIEGYQYVFKCGDVDVDDIVLNISGFLIGIILLLIQTKIKSKSNKNK